MMGRFWNRICRYPCRFFKLRANRTQTKMSLFILLDSKCSLSHSCSIGSSFFHSAKVEIRKIYHCNGAERCSRNWSEWKGKVEGNSETQFRFASAPQVGMLADLWSKPTNSNWAQNKLAREASQSWLVLKVREPTDIIRSLTTLLNN